MLGIRVDANNEIGMGHVMRCLSIAEEARRRGHEALFICAADGDTRVIEQQGFEYVRLSTGWKQYIEECDLIGEVLERFQISVLLIDSYYVTPEYMERCRSCCRTAYMDDLHERVWSCDILINYAIYADSFDYGKEYPETRRLLGCEYAPLREMFRHVDKVIREKASEILVLTGGTDPYHFARELAERVCFQSSGSSLRGGSSAQQTDRRQRHYTVVCGIYNEDRQRLEQMARDNTQLDVFFHVQNIKELMEQADIAVTAGGTTTYELAACGTPSICYSFVDNQLKNTAGFAKSGYMLYAGDLREHIVVKSVLDGIDTLSDNPEMRKEMSCRLQTLVDGMGAQRLVKALLEE